jgi:hypothetical protein
MNFPIKGRCQKSDFGYFLKPCENVIMKVDCYCAFCKNPRRVYRKKSLSLGNHVQALSLAVCLSFIFWQKLDVKGLLFYVMGLTVLETIILFRRRGDVTCPHCGFDAHLYIKDAAAACEKVKLHLKQRQEDPDVWLGKRPPLRFSRKSSKRDNGKSTREIIV